MKNIFLLATLISAANLNSYGRDNFEASKVAVKVDKIYKQILINNPKIDKRLAKKLSFSLNRFATKYKLDPHRGAAIAMQESGYTNAITYKNGKFFDVGMFQFNVRLIKEKKIDKKRVLNDLDYAVETYFKIMSEKKNLCKSLKEDAWVCYHSRTKGFREKYKKLVNRYYKSK